MDTFNLDTLEDRRAMVRYLKFHMRNRRFKLDGSGNDVEVRGGVASA